MAQSVGLVLGKPIEMSQESFRESYGGRHELNPDVPRSLNEAIEQKTLTLIACVKCVFELKSPKRVTSTTTEAAND